MAWTTEASKKVEKAKEEMGTALVNISLDDIRQQGMTVRIGGRVVKLEVSEETTLPEEDIRKEYQQKLNERLDKLRQVLNEKMSEVMYAADQSRIEMEERERKLQQRLAEANLMPEILYKHAQAGLSLVKGHPDFSRDANILTWIYQSVYWPKTYDNKPIDPKTVKKLITPVAIEIVTKGDSVVKTTVRKTLGLGKFHHYHGFPDGHGDCWGQWRIPAKWKNPDDILNIARHAVSVLDNINPMSPANREPENLPRLDTISENSRAGAIVDAALSRTDTRTGIEDAARAESGAVWST